MEQSWHKQFAALEDKVRHAHTHVVDIFIQSSAFSIIALCVGSLLVLGATLGLFVAWRRPLETEITIPIVEFQQSGEWHYQVYLKPNSLYQTSVLGPDKIYFTRLIDQIRAEFTYQLTSKPAPGSATYTYQVTAIFGSPEVWQTQFTLISPTTTSAQQFSVPIVIEFSELVNLLQTFHAETGTILFNPQLVIVGQVIPQVEIGAEEIATPFRQELRFEFDDETIQAKGSLEKSVPNIIERTQILEHPEVKRARLIWGGALLVSVTLLGYLIFSYRQSRASLPPVTRDLSIAQKKLQGLLIRTESELPRRDEHAIVQLESITALIALSEETLRPVTYTIHNQTATFTLFDERGAIQYEYVSGDQRTED